MVIEIKDFDLAEFVGEMIDVFEDYLDDKDILIPNDERDDRDDVADTEVLANIYGTDYDILADGIREIIDTWKEVDVTPITLKLDSAEEKESSIHRIDLFIDDIIYSFAKFLSSKNILEITNLFGVDYTALLSTFEILLYMWRVEE